MQYNNYPTMEYSYWREQAKARLRREQMMESIRSIIGPLLVFLIVLYGGAWIIRHFDWFVR